MFDRIIKVISMEQFQALQQSNILIIGIGGVGGYALECLVRSGVKNITICDFDVIEESNINRQIIANSNNIGELKANEAFKRMQEINPNSHITIHTEKITTEAIPELISSFDVVIDACDDTIIKAELICYTKDHNIPLISCMGTANRIHPEKLTIQKLSETKNDPLAKKLRNLLRKKGEKYLNTFTVCSSEEPIKTKNLGTICPVPMTAGALLASYTIQYLIQK